MKAEQMEGGGESGIVAIHSSLHPSLPQLLLSHSFPLFLYPSSFSLSLPHSIYPILPPSLSLYFLSVPSSIPCLPSLLSPPSSRSLLSLFIYPFFSLSLHFPLHPSLPPSISFAIPPQSLHPPLSFSPFLPLSIHSPLIPLPLSISYPCLSLSVPSSFPSILPFSVFSLSSTLLSIPLSLSLFLCLPLYLSPFSRPTLYPSIRLSPPVLSFSLSPSPESFLNKVPSSLLSPSSLVHSHVHTHSLRGSVGPAVRVCVCLIPVALWESIMPSPAEWLPLTQP